MPFSSSHADIDTTFAGLKALTIYCAGFSSHSIISICSLPSSFTIALTLAPLIPTHAPTGSTLGTSALTEIFVLEPSSLAMLTILTTPSLISATSSSKSLFKR